MAEATVNLKIVGRFSFMVLGMSVAAVALNGCDLTRNHLKMDRSGHMEVQDYRDALAPRIAEEEAKAAMMVDDDIPDFQSYIAGPSESLKPMPLVSISVNQSVPLRDALFELAAQAGYDIQLDPRIRGSIIFTSRQRPFDEVIERICDIAGLRYKFEEESVRIEMDTPFHKTYKIDYLSFIRKNSSSVRNDVSVVSGDGANTGSRFEATNTSESDFWAELETNLTQILGVAQSNSVLATANDPTITAAPAAPVAPVEPIVTQGPDGETIVQVTPPQATLNVQSLPTNVSGGSNSATTAQAARPGQSPDGSGFSVNRQAGMISINATERQHKKIEEYMTELRRSVTSQVLIEAKIMEVTLSDEYAVGINWNVLNNLIGEFNVGFSGAGALARPNLPAVIAGDPNFSLGYTGNDITAVIDAISRFGRVKALASPRLTVLNNQSAVLNVANNRVYFELDIDVTEATVNTPGTVSINSQIRNVPEGVLINVQPSIDLDSRTVSMSVRPTVTRIVDQVPDPGVAYVSQGLAQPIESNIPVVNIQEMDSVIRIPSGDALIMGGLMQDRSESTQNGVPVLSEIPLLGGAFRRQVDRVEKTELVIFLKATIIDGSNISNTDKDLYRRFSGDRRPIRM